MEPIIPPVDRELLRAELTPERKARDTKKAGNEIYIFPASECPALMREIGRLREIAFRGAGGGTGREVDTAETLGLLAVRCVEFSHSRPRVSNDNPYSESLFKTMKYTGHRGKRNYHGISG